jgi:hypothetical protein
MPDRVVRAGILTSDRVNELSWASEVFYRRLMSVTDDYGRYDARPSILRAELFALKLDRVSEPDIVKWLNECSKAGLVRIYTVNNKAYLEIQDFNQRLRAMKSKYPPPPDINGIPVQPPADNRLHLHTSADKCLQMPADAGLKRNETETETEKKDTPVGVGEAVASPLDPHKVYSDLVKEKNKIWEYIKDQKPDFIEPYVDYWNMFAKEKGLSQVTKISDNRKRKFKVRIKEPGFSFLTVLKKAAQSEFLLTNKWFGFDWIMENDSNYLKIIEGNYDNAPGGTHKNDSIQTPGPKTFDDELRYLVDRNNEGDLDERLILPEYYDKLQVRGLMPLGSLDRCSGSTIDEKKRQAVLQFIKANSNVGG